jgi:hypothetical protein
VKAIDLPRISVLSRTKMSRAPSTLNAVKGMVVAEAVAIGEAKVGLLRTFAELILTRSRELLPLGSVSDPKTRELKIKTK